MSRKPPTKATLESSIQALKAHHCMNRIQLEKVIMAEVYLHAGCLEVARKELAYVSNIMNMLEKRKLKEEETKNEEGLYS